MRLFSILVTMLISLVMAFGCGGGGGVGDVVGVNPPTAAVHADKYISLPGDYICFFDDSTDPDNDIVKREWDFTYDPVDGFQPEPDTYFNPCYLYQESGTYLVQLKVTDSFGVEDMLGKPLDIQIVDSIPPVALGDAYPKAQETYQLIHFFDAGSYDPDGGEIQYWNWDWENDGIFDGYGKNVMHAYSVAGTYYVQLMVRDDESEEGTLAEPLEINIVW
ncbi:MAG: PKD domain-containing protein [bacterium]|nr:PKD domain-containing protein [bacterium]